MQGYADDSLEGGRKSSRFPQDRGPIGAEDSQRCWAFGADGPGSRCFGDGQALRPQKHAVIVLFK